MAFISSVCYKEKMFYQYYDWIIFVKELVSYNPVTSEWTTRASMLVPRSQMGCVVLNDSLYVIGGTNRHNEVLQV